MIVSKNYITSTEESKTLQPIAFIQFLVLLFLYLFVGHLGCFQFLAIANSTAG